MNLKDLEYHYGLNKVTIELIVWVHSLFLFFFDALAFLVPRKRPSGDRREILVVKLDAIGDFIVWVVFCQGFAGTLPTDNPPDDPAGQRRLGRFCR
jgi:hypothetical protein